MASPSRPARKSAGSERFSYITQELQDPVAAMHKRNIASQWGLDVYSTNLNVQQFLNSVTRARSSGKISAGTPSLQSQLNRPTKLADIEIETHTAYLLKSKGVSELQEINRAVLLGMKIKQKIVEAFLSNPAFSPRHKTRITHYVDALQGVRNRSAFIEAAAGIQSMTMAMAFEEVAMMLEVAQRILIVPGYGMAVAQAQHAVRDLTNSLLKKDVEVEFGIHPVAGRMPGHMNVLLAEADIAYERLLEMDDVNAAMDQVDVAIVLGANDVVNPLARTDPGSPIAGMPIIDVDRARTVVVVKRSLSPGFAGIANPLFASDNALMLFGDGKQAITEVTKALEEG